MSNMKKVTLLAMSTVFAVSSLAGCSTEQTNPEYYKTQGFTNTENDTGIYLLRSVDISDFPSWTSDGLEKYPEVFKTIEEHDGNIIYMYKGVYSTDLNKLLSSQYYKSEGSIKTDVTVAFKETALYKSNVAYFEGEYEESFAIDPTYGFDGDLEEEDAEGVLITEEELAEGEWIEDEEDPEIMHNSHSSLFIFMGSSYNSHSSLTSSNYYKTRGKDKSKIALPNSFKRGFTSLGYYDKSYINSKGNIKSNKVSITKAAPKGVSVNGSYYSGRGSYSGSKGSVGGRGGGGGGA